MAEYWNTFWVFISDLSPLQWICAVFAAICIGLGKAGLSGIGLVAVLLMAQIMPARESTGAILPLLIIADIFAVRSFRQFAVWRHVRANAKRNLHLLGTSSSSSWRRTLFNNSVFPD